MFPADSGVGTQGPDHLTFDLADESKVSLSFYGKRPGPGMKLDKLSMQFSTRESVHAVDVLEAYERLILDAMRGDHTLFTHGGGHRVAVGALDPLAGESSCRQALPAGQLGPQRGAPARHPARLAAALRAGLARPQVTGSSAHAAW